jgi:hypothetical protein
MSPASELKMEAVSSSETLVSAYKYTRATTQKTKPTPDRKMSVNLPEIKTCTSPVDFERGEH